MINEIISQRLKEIFNYIAPNCHITLQEWNHDGDHIHCLFKAHPNSQLSKFINAYKAASSRLIKKEYPEIKKQLWKEFFWSKSFCLLTTGEPPLKLLSNIFKAKVKKTMRKTFKYRLYPNQEQRGAINQTLETCRILHNNILAEKKEAWEKEQRKITCFEQINSLPSKKETNSFLGQVFSQILQDIVRRVHKNFQTFFQRLKTGKAGYPRFKSKFRYDSFTYPQHGFKLVSQKQLQLSNIVLVNIRKHRELEGEVKTCSIIVKNGKYYVCFSCEAKPKPLPKIGKKAGTDLGLTSFLATSEGKLYQAPKTYRKAEKDLAKAQRKFSCFKCDYQENRDINAARNILARAEGLGTSLQGVVPIGAV